MSIYDFIVTIMLPGKMKKPVNIDIYKLYL
jgi:hypothetical protein